MPTSRNIYQEVLYRCKTQRRLTELNKIRTKRKLVKFLRSYERSKDNEYRQDRLYVGDLGANGRGLR